MNRHVISLLFACCLCILNYPRDPFSWEHTQQTTQTQASEYQVHGIIFNHVTHHYHALVLVNDTCVIVHPGDQLPDKALIHAITNDTVVIKKNQQFITLTR